MSDAYKYQNAVCRQAAIAIVILIGPAAFAEAARTRELIDDDWRFQRITQTHDARPPGADPKGWHHVDLPHDWSIATAPSADATSGGAGGFFGTGMGLYQRVIDAPEAWIGKRVSIEFEGVYQQATIWINGHRLGSHHYGYTPFRFELTEHLKLGERNTLTVQVDNSQQPNCRWYSGSGIYRHVWLDVRDPVNIVDDSVAVRTVDRDLERADVQCAFRLQNSTAEAAVRLVVVELVDPSGATVESAAQQVDVAASKTIELAQGFEVAHPQLWQLNSPALYAMRIRLFDHTGVLKSSAALPETASDSFVVKFGVRRIEISAERGCLLNGLPIKLLGGNVHHDHGPLGAASFDDAERRKVRLLKEAGFNAVRTAHNPPSRGFLQACDEQGLLVINEIYDGWVKRKQKRDYGGEFKRWYLDELETWVRRDRNHPSVIMWSIGNEVYERGDESGVELATNMASRIRALDPTRPVTAGINGLGSNRKWSELDQLFGTLDVAGYNYELARHREDHLRCPERVIYSAESYAADVFSTWRSVKKAPYVIGDFVWSAQDYLGEAGIGRVFGPSEQIRHHWEGTHFPWHGAACGDVDLIGQRKPVSHYRNVVWDRGEKLYAAVTPHPKSGAPWSLTRWSIPPAQASWTWPGREGEAMNVVVYSRWEAIELWLNGKRLGNAATGLREQFKATVKLPYEPGELIVKGLQDGRVCEEHRLATAGPLGQIRLTPSRPKIEAGRQSLNFIDVELCDSAGNVCTSERAEVKYDVTGPAQIVAIGSSDLTEPSSYLANPRRVHSGRALVVIRSTGPPGVIELRAQAGTIQGELSMKAADSH